MILTREQVQADIAALPENYKTKDVDVLIKRYVKSKADVSTLREYVLTERQFHRMGYIFHQGCRKIGGCEVGKAVFDYNPLPSDMMVHDTATVYPSYADEFSAEPRRKVNSPKGLDFPENLSVPKGQKLDELMSHMDETFSRMLLRLIDERGLKDSAVYHKANIDRRLF